MLNPVTTQNARNHEELNKLLQDINTLPEGANPDDFDNRKLVKIFDFLKSERSVGMDSKDFVEIIKGSEFKKDISKSVAINIFLESKGSFGIASKDFVEIIKGSEFEDENFKRIVINDFLKSERSFGIASKDFVEIIKGSELKPYTPTIFIYK